MNVGADNRICGAYFSAAEAREETRSSDNCISAAMEE